MKKKNTILISIQNKLPLSYRDIDELYEITKSYDAILEINDIALKYNKNHKEVALFLFKDKL